LRLFGVSLPSCWAAEKKRCTKKRFAKEDGGVGRLGCWRAKHIMKDRGRIAMLSTSAA